MALTKTQSVDQITITGNGTILTRLVTCIREDDVEISKTFHRSSFAPGADLSSQPANVVAIASAAWTPEIIAAYEAA